MCLRHILAEGIDDVKWTKLMQILKETGID
jgi:hypothetical protein